MELKFPHTDSGQSKKFEEEKEPNWTTRIRPIHEILSTYLLIAKARQNVNRKTCFDLYLELFLCENKIQREAIRALDKAQPVSQNTFVLVGLYIPQAFKR